MRWKGSADDKLRYNCVRQKAKMGIPDEGRLSGELPLQLTVPLPLRGNCNVPIAYHRREGQYGNAR